MSDIVGVIVSRAIDDLQDLIKSDKIKDTTYFEIKSKHYPSLEGYLALLPPIVDMFNSHSFKLSIVGNKFVISISKLLELCEFKHFSSQAELKEVLFAILEGLAKSTKALLINKDMIFQNLLPVLTSKLKSNVLDTRCECLKHFMAIIIQYLSEESVYDPQANTASTKLINDTIIKLLLPNYGIILMDKDPIPLFGLALLNAILDRNQGFVSILNKIKLVGVMFEYFVVGHPRMNSNTVKIIKSFIESTEITLEDLQSYDAFNKISIALEFMVENQIDNTAEDILDITIMVLKQFMNIMKTKSISASAAIDTIPEQAMTIYRAIYKLTGPFNYIAKYFVSEVKDLVDKSSQYMILILQLFGARKCKDLNEIYIKNEHIQYLIDGLSSEDQSIQKRFLKCILYGMKQKEKPLKLTSIQKEAMQEKLEKLKKSDDKSILSTTWEILKKINA